MLARHVSRSSGWGIRIGLLDQWATRMGSRSVHLSAGGPHCETNLSEFRDGKLSTGQAYELHQKQKCSKVTINGFFATISILAVSRAGWLDVI
jgi:hypothetical protein